MSLASKDYNPPSSDGGSERKRLQRAYRRVPQNIRKWLFVPLVGIPSVILGLMSSSGQFTAAETEYGIQTLIFIVIWAIVALSLNLEYGYTGLVNFGVAGFFLIGGYSTAIMITFYRGYFAWTGNEVVGAFLFGILAAIIICAIVGAALSAIGARLREDYFGILTLVFAEILRQGINDTDVSSIYGGPDGINGLPSIFPHAVYVNAVLSSAYIVVISAVVFVLSYLISWRIVNSPFGRSMRAIKDDELAAQSVGKFTLWYKIQIMMTGSSITAVAGGIYTLWILSTNPAFFLPAFTFQIFIISIMGGSASLNGAILGSTLFWIIQRIADLLKGTSFTVLSYHFGLSATQAPNLQYIITGLLLILFVILRPQGIVTESTIKTGKTQIR